MSTDTAPNSRQKPTRAFVRKRAAFLRGASYQSQKIAAAIEAEVIAGTSLDVLTGLRPVERRHRLLQRMRALGYRESELPSARAFRRYFNGV